ncbi:MAG: hypothetical protein RL419_968, partial [Actinomycetota bacterium]
MHNDARELASLGERHLWGHFTNLSLMQRIGLPVIERGEGAYVYDAQGKKYLDGLSGLFTVN